MKIHLKAIYKLMPNVIIVPFLCVLEGLSGERTSRVMADACEMMSVWITRVHLVTVHVRAAMTAADAGEGSDGVPVAVTVTVNKQPNIDMLLTKNQTILPDSKVLL